MIVVIVMMPKLAAAPHPRLESELHKQPVLINKRAIMQGHILDGTHGHVAHYVARAPQRNIILCVRHCRYHKPEAARRYPVTDIYVEVELGARC